MLEGGELPYADYMRLASLFPELEVVGGTAIIREARSVKTPLEIELFRRSAALHARAYSKIPDVYHPGTVSYTHLDVYKRQTWKR